MSHSRSSNARENWKKAEDSTWKKGWAKLRLRALQRDSHLCQLCLPRYRPATEVDHIIPRSKGGTNDLGNLMSVCSECHAEKSKAEANPAYRARVEIGVDGWPVGDARP